MTVVSDLAYIDSSGQDFGLVVDAEGRMRVLDEDQPAPRGIRWIADDREIRLVFDAWVEFCVAPEIGAVVVYGFPSNHKSFARPDNAAIYNADGTVRCRLRVPKVLARAFPGCTLTPEAIAVLPPDGFWRIGKGCSDGIKDLSVPWMWAEIGYGYDFFERRYFDPRTGRFDTTHFSAGRR